MGIVKKDEFEFGRWIKKLIVEKSEEEPRMDLVADVRWKIANGFYDLDFVREEFLERLDRALRNEE